jgi:hypothetical protein
MVCTSASWKHARALTMYFSAPTIDRAIQVLLNHRQGFVQSLPPEFSSKRALTALTKRNTRVRPRIRARHGRDREATPGKSNRRMLSQS